MTGFSLQVVALHPSCGLETQPEWVIFNEFALTTRPYLRTVTEVRPEWCVQLLLPHMRLSYRIYLVQATGIRPGLLRSEDFP